MRSMILTAVFWLGLTVPTVPAQPPRFVAQELDPHVDNVCHAVTVQGRGTRPPNWGEGQGVRVLVYDVPDDPIKQPWPVEIAEETLHTIHNLQLVDVDGDRRDEIVMACWEGVFLLDRELHMSRLWRSPERWKTGRPGVPVMSRDHRGQRKTVAGLARDPFRVGASSRCGQVGFTK